MAGFPSGAALGEASVGSDVIRQLREDITACEYDLNFCQDQLTSPNLTPQETRNLHLRSLDLGHEIRRSRHRIENLEAAAKAAAEAHETHCPSPAASSYKNQAPACSANSGYSTIHATGSQGPDSGQPGDGGTGFPQTVALQRLGFWSCRLCTSDKYKLAGANRQPAAPCKWPLKDIAKMMTHYLDLHTEHEAEERCRELGDALRQNPGPFEYWLRRTRSQKIEESTMEDAIEELTGGVVPMLLKNLSRAAAEFPGKPGN